MSAHLNIVSSSSEEYVTFRLEDQLLGIHVLRVHDVLNPQKVTRIPLAPPAVAGVLNLRGKIVTAIDLRKRLGLPPQAEGERSMSIVVEYRGEPYSLQIDTVEEVLSLSGTAFDRNPVTLEARWREVCDGIYRLKSELLVILNVERLLDMGQAEAA